jgi:hypothetical protein
MNFMFRLGSYPQDTHYACVNIPKSLPQKNPKPETFLVPPTKH